MAWLVVQNYLTKCISRRAGSAMIVYDSKRDCECSGSSIVVNRDYSLVANQERRTACGNCVDAILDPVSKVPEVACCVIGSTVHRATNEPVRVRAC